MLNVFEFEVAEFTIHPAGYGTEDRVRRLEVWEYVRLEHRLNILCKVAELDDSLAETSNCKE